jgi:hypothetical protein
VELEKVPTCLINVFYSYFFQILEAPGVKACGAMIELGMVGRGPTSCFVVLVSLNDELILFDYFRLQIFDI